MRDALGYALRFRMDQQEPVLRRLHAHQELFLEFRPGLARACRAPAELKSSSRSAARFPTRSSPRRIEPPKTDGTGDIRDNLRAGAAAPRRGRLDGQGRQAGRRADGQPLAFEIPARRSPTFERVVAAVRAEPGARSASTMNVRTVDPAQYQNRMRQFRLRHDGGRAGPSRSRPATSSAITGARRAADEPGSQNFIGIKSKAVDALVDLIITRRTAPSLVDRTPCARSRAAVGLLRHSELASDLFPRRATGTSSACPKIPPPYALGARHLVGRSRPSQDVEPKKRREPKHAARERIACSPTSLRRLLLIIPTLFGIMLVNFVIVQAAPGGPVEQMHRASITGHGDRRPTARVGGAAGGETGAGRARQRDAARLSRRARPRSRLHRAAQASSSASTSRRCERFVHHDEATICRFDFGTSFFQRPAGDRADR